MSQENVEIVRRIWEASERRDTDAVFALYDPTIVWDFSHAAPVELRGLYHGYDGIRQFFRQWLEPFDDFYVEAETFIDAGDSVVVGYRQGGRGKASGVNVEMPAAWSVYRIRDGLVTRIEVFPTEPEAIEAAGLSE